MKRLNKFIEKHKKNFTFLTLALFLGIIANLKCHPDPYGCDPIGLGECVSCVPTTGDFYKWVGTSIGLLIVLKLGAYLDEQF